MDGRANPLNGRLLIGLLLATLGVLWTFDNLGLVDASLILRWWPALLLAAGLMQLTGFGMDRRPVAGSLLTVFGGILLLNRLGVMHVGFDTLWPLALVAFGVSIVIRSLYATRGGSSKDQDDRVNSFAFMGGVTRRNVSQSLRGGDLNAVMGGIELDLTGARPADGRVIIDVFALWGGIEIYVPHDWRVESEVVPIMAGVEDNSRFATGSPVAGTLVLRGLALMGGVEIKNGKANGSGGVRVVSEFGRREDGGVVGVVGVASGDVSVGGKKLGKDRE